MNNRIKENLLPVIEDNIHTNYEQENEVNKEDDENIINEEAYKITIYSDCYSHYQKKDYKNMGYILHRVNSCVWFEQSLFFTNTIEVWENFQKLD